MEYSIAADEECLRVTASGRDSDRPPSEFCTAVLAESRKQGRNRILIEFITLLGAPKVTGGRSVRELPLRRPGAKPAKAWLRGEADPPEA